MTSLNIFVYYFNTSEIPGELSRVNMISPRVKITCYFTRENNMLFSQPGAHWAPVST